MSGTAGGMCRRSGPRNGRGFTLIELLVVVAIIGVLVSILTPALGRARKQVQGTRCLAHCRELGHGMAMYHNEFGCFPGHQFRRADDSRFRWFHAMEKYVAGFATQACPAAREWWEVGRNNSYGYNYKYIGSARDNTSLDNPHRPYERFPVREVRSPARTIAFADCDGTGRELPWMPEKPLGDNNKDRWGNHGYTLDPTYIPKYSLQTTSAGEIEPYAWKYYRTFMSNRHLGKASVVFTDSHGEHVKPAEAYRDNGLWNGLGFDPADDPNSPYYALDDHVDYRVHASTGQVWPF